MGGPTQISPSQCLWRDPETCHGGTLEGVASRGEVQHERTPGKRPTFLETPIMEAEPLACSSGEACPVGPQQTGPPGPCDLSPGPGDTEPISHALPNAGLGLMLRFDKTPAVSGQGLWTPSSGGRGGSPGKMPTVPLPTKMAGLPPPTRAPSRVLDRISLG